MQHYDVSINYKPGKEMYLADTLSRAHPTSIKRSEVEEETEHIHVTQFVAISEPQLEKVRRETACDRPLQLVIKTIQSGWPNDKDRLPTELRPYHDIRDELSIHDGVIVKGQRCVIPLSVRQEIREKVHASHIGLQGCLRRARELVYWPGMNKDLTDFISKCDTCATQQIMQPKEPLIQHDLHLTTKIIFAQWITTLTILKSTTSTAKLAKP
jgi:hypothetical protein